MEPRWPGGLCVSFGSSGLGSSLGQGHSVASVFGQITLLSQCLSSPRRVNEYWSTEC